MHHVLDSEDFKLTNEVDEAHWYSIEEARKQIKQGSLAHSFLEKNSSSCFFNTNLLHLFQ
jgi:NADH pyrophosphatase NudC (nudix superfamily)